MIQVGGKKRLPPLITAHQDTDTVSFTDVLETTACTGSFKWVPHQQCSRFTGFSSVTVVKVKFSQFHIVSAQGGC